MQFGLRKLRAKRSFTGRLLQEEVITLTAEQLNWLLDIAIPTLYAIDRKSCVRVCNLNQLSQRSAFEALVQACEQLGVELEARTGHKAVQHMKIRRVAARR